MFDLFDRLDSYAELVDRLRSEVAHERSEREAGKQGKHAAAMWGDGGFLHQTSPKQHVSLTDWFPSFYLHVCIIILPLIHLALSQHHFAG